MITNVTRQVYRELSEEEKLQLDSLKQEGENFISLINSLGNKREYSLSITKMEEAVMWAVKGFTT
jgi:hypothetical protein